MQFWLAYLGTIRHGHFRPGRFEDGQRRNHETVEIETSSDGQEISWFNRDRQGGLRWSWTWWGSLDLANPHQECQGRRKIPHAWQWNVSMDNGSNVLADWSLLCRYSPVSWLGPLRLVHRRFPGQENLGGGKATIELCDPLDRHTAGAVSRDDLCNEVDFNLPSIVVGSLRGPSSNDTRLEVESGGGGVYVHSRHGKSQSCQHHHPSLNTMRLSKPFLTTTVPKIMTLISFAGLSQLCLSQTV